MIKAEIEMVVIAIDRINTDFIYRTTEDTLCRTLQYSNNRSWTKEYQLQKNSNTESDTKIKERRT